MKIKDISIKYKIIVFALILSIIPVTIIGLYAYNEASNSLNKEVQNKLEEQVKLEKDSIDTTFSLSQDNVNSSLGVAKTSSIPGENLLSWMARCSLVKIML